MIQFHGWLVGQQPLSTHSVQSVSIRDKVDDEVQTRVFKCYRYSGPSNDQYRYAVYEDRTRQKFTPYNGDQVRFSEWAVARTWEEPAGYKTIKTCSRERVGEEKEVEHHSAHSMFGFSSNDHTHYCIYRTRWTEEWTVTTDFDGSVTETQPKQVGGQSRTKIASDREHGFTSGYQRIIS
jgi:hypothetical protein